MSAFARASNAPVRLAILRCPFCAAAEPVDEAALARQATMIACRQCGEAWPAREGLPTADEQSARWLNDDWRYVPISRQPAIEAVRRPLAAYGDAGPDPWMARLVADQPCAPPARRSWAVALSCLAAMVFMTGFVAARHVAVAAAPDLAGLYAAVGLPVQLRGLAVEDVEAERRIGGTGAVVKVRGRVVNLGDAERAVPPLLLHFQDPDGAVLFGSSAGAPVKTLPPGGAARFVVEVDEVPSRAAHVLVRLQEPR